VAHCRQELLATINSVVVSRYTRLDSFVVKHIAHSLDDEFVRRFRITPPTDVHLSLNSPSTSTYTFNSLVFHPCCLVPRFPIPRFQRPVNIVSYRLICAICRSYCAVGRSLVSATIDESRCATTRSSELNERLQCTTQNVLHK